MLTTIRKRGIYKRKEEKPLKQIKRIVLFFPAILLLLVGCTGTLDENTQRFEDQGVSYEMQLPAGWKKDKEQNYDYGLETAFSAEDKNTDSYLFISTIPVAEVKQKEFGEETRKKIKERYKYKTVKDVYMKEYKVGNYLTYKYTVHTNYKEKPVWAHFYYIWTDNGFVQMTFYSADDNSFKKRSKQIEAAVETFKEVGFNKKKAKKSKENQKKEEGDVVTIENNDLKMEITAVRKVKGENNKELLAIRYAFTNQNEKSTEPSIWKEFVTAKQADNLLPIGQLPKDYEFLDVKELAETQTVPVKKGESVESVVLYELVDQSTVELTYAQEAFPDKQPTRVVVPE